MALSAPQWDDLRARFQAGISVRCLARIYVVNESTIREKAKRFGWQRDPVDDGHDTAHSPEAPHPDTGTSGQLGVAGAIDRHPGHLTKADRRDAKQQRFDELTAALKIALSYPVAGDAAAAERRAQALAAVKAEGGLVAALQKASKLARTIAVG